MVQSVTSAVYGTNCSQRWRHRCPPNTESQRKFGDGSVLLLDGDLADIALMDEVLDGVDELTALGAQRINRWLVLDLHRVVLLAFRALLHSFAAHLNERKWQVAPCRPWPSRPRWWSPWGVVRAAVQSRPIERPP